MVIWVTGVLMGCLGYWLAHYGLETKRRKVLGVLTKAEDIPVRLEADKAKVLEDLQYAKATLDRANQYEAAEWAEPDEADRSREGGDDKQTAV